MAQADYAAQNRTRLIEFVKGLFYSDASLSAIEQALGVNPEAASTRRGRRSSRNISNARRPRIERQTDRTQLPGLDAHGRSDLCVSLLYYSGCRRSSLLRPCYESVLHCSFEYGIPSDHGTDPDSSYRCNRGSGLADREFVTWQYCLWIL